MTITVSYDGTKFSGGKFPEDAALLAGIKPTMLMNCFMLCVMLVGSYP